MKNPFSIAIVQDEESFCNRVKERAELIRHAKNSSNVVIWAPRRYGKSSLVKLVLKDLQNKKFLTSYVDLFPVSSEQDLVTRFASSLFKSIGKGVDPRSFMDKIKGFFACLRPVLQVTPEGYSITTEFERTTGIGILLDDLMEGINNYVKKKKLSACIVLDEFQEITELSQAKKIEGILRSHIQNHQNIAYFFVGSRRRILQDMFQNKSRPFYKSAFFYPLHEISQNDFVPFIEKIFTKSGKFCSSNVAQKIWRSVRGFPYYVQKLASVAWDITTVECTEEITHEAIKLLIKSEGTEFEGMWQNLSAIQKSVLKALSLENTATPFAKDYLRKYQCSIGGVQKAIKSLLKMDLIETTPDKIYRLTDPIMESWIKESVQVTLSI